MTKRQKVPVTMRAIIQRINRALKHDNEMLKTTRGERLRQQVGDFYVLDFSRNNVLNTHVDPEKMARDMEVLQPWEVVVEP
jgi:hypothetical protein